MALKYTYSTGQIERDFVLKKVEGDCHMDPERTILIGVMCKTCPYFQKMETFYNSSREAYQLGTGKIGTFVFCKYHKKDDEGTSDILHRMYEKFRDEAISHFYD